MIKNNKKAFTLIELLAVIVILAIIALIATPIILGIVEDARKDSFMRSVELVVGTTDIDIFSKDFSDTYTYTITDGNIPNLEVGVKNTDGMNGKIKYDSNGNDTYAIHNGKYCVIKEEGMKKAEIKDYVEGECELGKATDVKYFIYEEIEETRYEIVDKDACVDYFVEEWGNDEEDAISTCNNEPHPSVGLTLTEQLALGLVPQQEVILALKELGVIEEINISGIEITGYSEEGPKNVIIPEEINGTEVVSIGNFAFSDKSLTSVELPETIVRIRHSAFSTNLFTDITLPSSLEIVENYAFCYTNLDQTSVNNITGINEYAYCTVTNEDCFDYADAELVEYEIANVNACVDFMVDEYGNDEEDAMTVCNNEPSPFDGMTLTEYLASGEAPQEAIDELKEAGIIEEISVDGIEITGYNCAATDVVIPNKINNKEVLYIEENAFNYAGVVSYLNKGTIRPVNYELAGSLFAGNITSIVLPDSVRVVFDSAFYSNPISKLKLSSGLKSIGRESFAKNALMQIVIPDSVIEIKQYAFYYNQFHYNVILSNNSQLRIVENYAFDCIIPEDSNAYQIILDINSRAIGSCID